MAKYYYWNAANKMWTINKRINGQMHFFGYYKTEKAAQLAVKLYQKYGWKKENNWRIKHEVKQIIGGKNGSS